MKMFVIATLLTLTSLSAQAGVQYLGQTRLGQGTDRDVVYVGGCGGGVQSYNAIKLQVLRRGAEINHLKVVYENGVRDILQVRQFFAPGSESRWIDFQGGYRCIQKIVVVGDTQKLIPIGQQSVVRVYGLR